MTVRASGTVIIDFHQDHKTKTVKQTSECEAAAMV